MNSMSKWLRRPPPIVPARDQSVGRLINHSRAVNEFDLSLPGHMAMDIQRDRTFDAHPIAQYQNWFIEEPSLIKVTAVWASCRIAAGLQFVRGSQCDDGFGILMYHRVSEEIPGVATPTMNVTPQQLRLQLAGLLGRGFECWSLTRLIEVNRQQGVIPANVFAVTFDDGFENNYWHAWPVLRELNLPATIFVATKYLDTEEPFPFDDWSAAGTGGVPPLAWRPLTSAQCEEMLIGGLIEIGAHTHSHQKFLGRCGEFRHDMKRCLDVLRGHFGIERPTFAFPYGYKSPELVDAARQVGVCCSLSTRARRVVPGEDEFEWGRLWVEQQDTPTMLSAKLSWYPRIATAANTVASRLARFAGTRDCRADSHRGPNGDTARSRKEPAPR